MTSIGSCAALGAANIASAISQGFAVSGADSRTAMSDAAGGRTRVTGLVTAVAVAAVLLFFTAPLQYVPIAALGAVLVKAAFSLLDIGTLKTFYQVDRRELMLSLLATLGVATVGAVPAILVAVILAILRFVRLVSRPKVDSLGKVPLIPGLLSTGECRDDFRTRRLSLQRSDRFLQRRLLQAQRP
jgi:MFS superfamily sulfate permease-like transporter